MANPDALTQLLQAGPQPARVLYERLGVSQPTLSRWVAQAGVSILRFGQARQSQYALRRPLGGHGQFPLFRVGESGGLERWGTLHTVARDGYLVETAAGAQAEPRRDYLEGLPWYLQDMRPQGFLGRAWARWLAPRLGLPEDFTRWSDDQTLLALAQTGVDCPGNLLVGEEAASLFQTQALLQPGGNTPPLPSEQRPGVYPELARLALAGEAVGSSAGGEQPKFAATVMHNGAATPVLVKFTAPQDNAATRRWQSLLICEHLALRTLAAAGLPASSSELLAGNAESVDQRQLFLEVRRFDRAGVLGRRGVATLAALDNEFAGQAGAPWPRISEALLRLGLLGADAHSQVQRLHAFGTLIGNTDMHGGNLSLLYDGLPSPIPPFTLAAAYDMLPMALAPRASGLIPDQLPPLRIGVDPPLDIWLEVLPWARDYWQQVAEHGDIADDVRRIAGQRAEALAGPLAERG